MYKSISFRNEIITPADGPNPVITGIQELTNGQVIASGFYRYGDGNIICGLDSPILEVDKVIELVRRGGGIKSAYIVNHEKNEWRYITYGARWDVLEENSGVMQKT